VIAPAAGDGVPEVILLVAIIQISGIITTNPRKLSSFLGAQGAKDGYITPKVCLSS
jgi:hypothetical protein